MKNKLSDLNNHLFEQLERLNDEELNGDDLTKEIERSRAITDVAKTIINNGELVLRAQKHKDEYHSTRPGSFPEMLSLEDK